MRLPLLDLSLVTIARYVSEAILTVRGLMLAWLLEPAGFGVWTSMRLVVMFSRYAHIGTRSGMVQRASFADGRDQPELAAGYRRTAAGVDLGSAALAAGIVVAVVLLLEVEHLGWWLWVAALVFVTHVHGYYMTLLASLRRFGLYAGALVAFALLSTVVGLGAAFEFGLGGYLAVLVGAYALVVAGGALLGPAYPRPALDLAMVRDLVVTGFPIMAASLTFVLLWNMDKLLIWALRGSEPLGVYAVQAFFMNGVMLLPGAVHQVVRPHLLEQLGRSADEAAARHYLGRGTLLLGLLAVPVVGVVYLLLHVPIRWLLPQYVAAIAPGELLVLVTFFALVASVPSTVLISLDAAWTVIVARLLGIAVAGAMITAALLDGRGFVAVAGGLAAGLIVYAVLTIGAALRRTRLPAGDTARLVGWLAASFTLLVALLAVLPRVIPDAPDEWPADLIRTAARCTVLLAVLLPPTVIVVRRLNLVQPPPSAEGPDALDTIEPDIG